MASITKRLTKSGTRWRVQIRRPGLKPINRTAQTKGEAQEMARALERELDLGRRVVSRNMTVGELTARYTNDAGGEHVCSAAIWMS